MDNQPNTDLQFVNRISQQIRRLRCRICKKSHQTKGAGKDIIYVRKIKNFMKRISQNKKSDLIYDLQNPERYTGRNTETQNQMKQIITQIGEVDKNNRLMKSQSVLQFKMRLTKVLDDLKVNSQN